LHRINTIFVSFPLLHSILKGGYQVLEHKVCVWPDIGLQNLNDEPIDLQGYTRKGRSVALRRPRMEVREKQSPTIVVQPYEQGFDQLSRHLATFG
jgi:hypothetical protein